ncbi:MAG TPA: prepilin-type N-terminal cleavage/methylation domain-containing protein [Acidobacteriota bacterium]|nr:prepilin-type N-terminal cleavage/methylation domain-containing protein [Acidobacteriota bacterium]
MAWQVPCSRCESSSPAKGKDAGITLIEVLSAMLVFALGILALAPMVVLSIESNGRAVDLTSATILAQNTIEEYRKLDSLPPAPYSEITIDSLNGLTSQLNIDDSGSDGTIPTDMQRISVTITWMDKAGVDRRIEYSTLVTP